MSNDSPKNIDSATRATDFSPLFLHFLLIIHSPRLVQALASKLHHALRFCYELISSLNNNVILDCEMHEVITLQFGQQANHVGTHFWNAQVSLNFHNVPSHSRIWEASCIKAFEIKVDIDSSLYHSSSRFLAGLSLETRKTTCLSFCLRKHISRMATKKNLLWTMMCTFDLDIRKTVQRHSHLAR
jgi:hypothetical protein